MSQEHDPAEPRVTVRFPPEVYAAIKRLAHEGRRSLNNQVIVLVERALAQQQQQQQEK